MCANKDVLTCASLDSALSTGAYNKILQASNKLPSPEYSVFMSQLITTVQEKIADGAEAAYDKFPKKEVGKLLMIKSDSELNNFIQQRGWTLNGDTVILGNHSERGKAKQLHIPAEETILHTLSYATELERIV